jgi:hypothetical protein
MPAARIAGVSGIMTAINMRGALGGHHPAIRSFAWSGRRSAGRGRRYAWRGRRLGEEGVAAPGAGGSALAVDSGKTETKAATPTAMAET